MRYLRLLPLLLVAAFTIGSMGCKTNVPYQVSVGGPLMKRVKVIGRVEGLGTARYFLGGFVGPIGDDSLKAAVADALSKKGGDSLINVTVDREVKTFIPGMPIMIEIKTRVTGLAIQYTG